MRSRSSAMKFSMQHLVLGVAVLALAALSPTAHAVNYTPGTAIVVYVHGFDNNGWTYTNVYGDDSMDVLSDVMSIATFTGRPTWQDNPVAPNQVCGATYYGTQPPAWYTADDIAADAAAANYVPKYALRMAKYIKHVLNRSGATSAIVLAGSFGGEITRYMIEKNLCNLASDQLISRWFPVVGVVRGNWAAQNVPSWLAQIFGENPSPDIQNMKYDWVNANISANTTMNSAYFGPMIVSQFCANDDADGIITALNNNANDGTNMTTDEFFAGYSTTAALHAATDGTLQMPGYSIFPTEHTGIVDHLGAWAGLTAAAENNQRVTIKLSRLKALTSGETLGNGEWVYSAKVVSPRAQALYGVTAPMTEQVYSNGSSPKFSMAKGATITPNSYVFDQIVPPGETTLTVTIQFYELDWFNKFYGVYEIGSTKDMGALTATVSATSGSVVTVSNGNYQADLTTTIKSVY